MTVPEAAIQGRKGQRMRSPFLASVEGRRTSLRRNSVSPSAPWSTSSSRLVGGV